MSVSKIKVQACQSNAREYVSLLREVVLQIPSKDKVTLNCYLRAAYFDAVTSLDKINKAMDLLSKGKNS